VEYIHTNKTNVLVELDAANCNGEVPEQVPEQCQEDFQTLLTLTAAAAYYRLPKFCHEIHRCLASYLNAFPLLACVLLEACSQQGPVISDDLKQSAMSNIKKLLLNKDFDDFDAEILATLSPTEFELILFDTKASLSEQRCFWLIDLWCQAGLTQNRRSIATELVKNHVILHLIDPDVLSTSVTSSGLVTLEQLVETYKFQAIRAKHQFKVSFSKQLQSFKCPDPTWNGTESITFDNKASDWESETLKCPILLAGGRYTWTVNITGESHVWLGVALSTASEDVRGNSFAGYMRGCYGFYGTDGLPYSCGQKGAFLGKTALLKCGDRVTMTLDLSSDDVCNGTLSVSVNGQPTVRILSDMHAKLPAGDGIGYVPLASCFQSGVIIESIEEFCPPLFQE
jgi:hypothetical protein